MEIAERIAALANALDEARFVHLADSVDSALTGLVKTAQYVGVQGYWVRNERCWSNCYRQKRAANPGKPAQEVWFDCQKEYSNSLGNADTTWDKYAEGEVVIKTAGYHSEDQQFHNKLADRVAGGSDPGTAAFDIFNERNEQIRASFFDASAKLFRVSEALDDVNDAFSKEAAECANGLLKLAWPSWLGKKKPAPAPAPAAQPAPGQPQQFQPGQFDSFQQTNNQAPKQQPAAGGTQPQQDHMLVGFLESFPQFAPLAKKVQQWSYGDQEKVFNQIMKSVQQVIGSEDQRRSPSNWGGGQKENFSFPGMNANLSGMQPGGQQAPAAPQSGTATMPNQKYVQHWKPGVGNYAPGQGWPSVAEALEITRKFANSGAFFRLGSMESEILATISNVITTSLKENA